MVKLHDFFIDMWLAVKSSSLLFILVVITIATGATCSSGLIGVLRGLQQQENELLNALGANVAAVAYRSSAAGNTGRIVETSFNDLRTNNEAYLSSLSKYSDVLLTGVGQSVRLVQTDHNLASVHNWMVVRGRFIDSFDLKSRARVAVISEWFGAEFGWQLGGVIELAGQPYRIVGVLNDSGLEDQPVELKELSFQQRSIFIPLSIVPHWQSAQNRSYSFESTLFIRVQEGYKISVVIRRIKNYITGTGIDPNELSWITPAALTSGIVSLKKTIVLSLGTLALLLFMVAMVSLFATLANSVRIRFSEIGLRRAQGARKTDIARMFVLEGALIAFFGAVIGIVIAAAIGPFVSSQLSVPITLDGWMLFFPLVFYVLVGAVASLWPACVAAGLSPAQCLRI